MNSILNACLVNLSHNTLHNTLSSFYVTSSKVALSSLAKLRFQKADLETH